MKQSDLKVLVTSVLRIVNNKEMLKENTILSGIVREIIQEAKKKKNTYKKDELGKNNVVGDDNRLVKSKSKTEMCDEISKLATGIDKNTSVYWDDHDDLKVDLLDRIYIRISERFTNSFNVEAFKNLADRIYAVNLNYDQLKDFVKVNLENLDKDDAVQSAFQKSLDNSKDKENTYEKKTVSHTVNTGKKAKNSKPVDNEVEKVEDLPDSPMTEVDVDDVEKQSDHKEKSLVKPKKPKN